MAGSSGKSKQRKKHNRGKLRTHSRFSKKIRKQKKRQEKKSH